MSAFFPNANLGNVQQIPQVQQGQQTNAPPKQAANTSRKAPLKWAIPNGPKSNAELALSCLCVDVFQLNIGVGDSAVYYLVEHPTDQIRQALPDAKPFIHRAVLIDGGLEAGSKYIRNFLENKVGLMYDYDDSQGSRSGLLFPPFDSIVITHWDQDHYAGVLALCHHDLCETQLVQPVSQRLSLFWYLSPFMKYSNDAFPLPNNAPPNSGVLHSRSQRGTRAQTTLVVPYWGQLAPSEDVDDRLDGEYALKFKFEIMGEKGCICIDAENYQKSWNEGQGFLDWNSASSPRGKKRVEEEWAKKLCLFRCGTAQLLGLNLFTDLKPLYEDALESPSPGALAEKHHAAMLSGGQPKWAIPMLLIVMVNLECCGWGKDPNGARRREFLGAIDTVKAFYEPYPKHTFDPVKDKDLILEREANPERMSEAEPEVLQRFNPDKTKIIPANPWKVYPEAVSSWHAQVNNQTSHAIPTNFNLVNAPNVNSSNPNNGIGLHQPFTPGQDMGSPFVVNKIVDEDYSATRGDQSKWVNAISISTLVVWSNSEMSHWASGDAMWDQELKFLAWVWLSKNHPQSVRSIKISHHGSSYSLPREVVQHLRPRTLVLSAGTKHFHPRFEVLLWLNLWFQATSGSRYVPSMDPDHPKMDVGMLCATNYPYYLLYGLVFDDEPDDYISAALYQDKSEANRRNPVQPSFHLFENWFPPGSSTKGLDLDQADIEYLNSMNKLLFRVIGAGVPYVQDMISKIRIIFADPELEYYEKKVKLFRYILKVTENAWTSLSETHSASSAYYDEVHAREDSEDPSSAQVTRGLGHAVIEGDIVQFVKIHCRPRSQEHRYMMDRVLDGTAQNASASVTAATWNEVGKKISFGRLAFAEHFQWYKKADADPFKNNKPNVDPKKPFQNMPSQSSFSTLSLAHLSNPTPTNSQNMLVNSGIQTGNQGSSVFQPNQFTPPQQNASINSQPLTTSQAQDPKPIGFRYWIRDQSAPYRVFRVEETANSRQVIKYEELSSFPDGNNIPFDNPFGVKLIMPPQYPVQQDMNNLFKANATSTGIENNLKPKFSGLEDESDIPKPNFPGLFNPGQQSTAQSSMPAKESILPTEQNASKPKVDPFLGGPHSNTLPALALGRGTQPDPVVTDKKPPVAAATTTKYTDLVPSTLRSIWDLSGRVNPIKAIPEDNFGMFLRTLQSSPCLVVDQNGLLSREDEYNKALMSFMGQDPGKTAGNISIVLSAVGKDDIYTIQSLTLTVPSFSTFPKLVFTTLPSSVGKNFAGSETLTTLPSTGIFPYHMFLTLGLDKSASDMRNWNFVEVLTYMKLVPDSLGVLLSLLFQAVGGTNDFELSKGMIWHIPAEKNKMVQRMEWNLLATVQEKVKKVFNDFLKLDLDLQNFRIIGRKTTTFQPDSDGGVSLIGNIEIIFGLTLGFGKADNPKLAIVDLEFDRVVGTGSSFTLNLKFDGTGSGPRGATMSDILGWLGSLINVPLDDILDWFPKINIASVKRGVLSCSKKSIDRIHIDLEILPGWKDETGKDIIFLFTYTWEKGFTYPHGLVGKIWFVNQQATWLAPWIMPDYEFSRVIQPSQPAVSRLYLKSILPDLPSLPGELALSISNFQVGISGPNITFQGRLDAMPDNPQKKSSLGIDLVSVALEASYQWGRAQPDGSKKADPASYMVKLSTDIMLSPITEGVSNTTLLKPARLFASVSLVSRGAEKLFQLYGGIANLQMSQLGRFFPEEDRAAVNDILGHLTLKYMTIVYDYSKTNGAANQFSISASIVIDVVELDLEFSRNQTEWSFKAELTLAEGVSTNVGKILKSLMGEDGKEIVDSMPPFLTNIELNNKSAGLRFTIESQKPPPSPQGQQGQPSGPSSLVFSLTLWLPGPGGTDFEFTFIQMIEKGPPPAGQMATAKTTARSRAKRMIKITINDLPWRHIPRPPVVDRIAPAFDQLGVFWVQDPTATKDSVGNTGLTLADMKKINTSIPYPVAYTPPPSTAPDTTVVLSAGMHFVILDSGGQGTPKMILDYAFNQPKTNTSNSGPLVEDEKKGTADSGLPNKSGEGSGTAKGSLQKTTKTLQIQNVGLRYEGGELIIFLDVIAHMGPIGLSLLGLGFGMKVADLKLSELGKHVPSLHLQGMGVAFNQPPVTIAGMFVERKNNDMKMYIGGIALSVIPYQFMAVGAYGEVKKNTEDGDTFAQAVAKGNTFKTVFIFAKLNGPLIDFGFATIGGITLGFGYNSTVVHPTVETVYQFPFIANGDAVSGSSDPLSIMSNLADPVGGVVRPRLDSFWIAAGLEAKAFQILEVAAVVILEFNPYVSLGIYARATASMPPEAPRFACFTYVELGILAYVDFHLGQFRVEAQLSPNSFVMNPLCHLSGGFAMCTWFGPSPYAGDFVFSIGGYHPAYKPPAHYPKPPRLKISWGFSDILCISGEAYFAVTTKVCMGGGKLSAVFNMGVLHAYLTAYADFLMEFQPFFFTADIGVRIGVEFELELLFVTIHISVHISAALHLQGPPFGGYVHVDFWVFGFTIPFGDQGDGKPAKTVEEFCKLLIDLPGSQPAPTPATADKKNPSVSELHTLSVEAGRYTEKQKDGDTPHTAMWEVKSGGFVFRVQSKIPVQTIVEPKFKAEPTGSITCSTPFYSVPMHLKTQLSSNMKVYITREEEPADEDIGFRMTEPVMKDLPLSIWGKYDPKLAPGKGNNNISALLDTSTKGTALLMTGATFTAPPPIISKDKIPAFNVIEASALDVYPLGKYRPSLPESVTYVPTTWNTVNPESVPIPIIPQDQPQPDVRENLWRATKNAWEYPAFERTEGQSHQLPVQHTIDAFTSAFAWDYAADGNVLQNEITTEDGNEPRIWREFTQLYMAAPMVGLAA